MIEVKIESVRVSLMSQNRVVVLREEGGQRLIPIWIGPYEEIGRASCRERV